MCDEGDCLVTIDLELTTKTDAEKAVSEMAKKKTDYGLVITQISSFVSVPVTTTGAEAVQVSVVQLPPLPYHIPEAMFNEMVKYQVGIKAESVGFIVASNTSTIDNVLAHCSQYFNSRPDLSIYHPEKSVAYVVQATQLDEEMDEEMDEEPDKAQYVAIKADVIN